MDDLISRQQAIDAVKKLSFGETDATRLAMRIVDYLESMPTAEPEKHIVAEIKVDGEELQRLVDEAVERMRNEDTDEWCTDCKEYDSERHCCPRFNRVIRDAVEEVWEKIIHCSDCKHWNKLLNLCKRTKHMALGVNGFCSKAERREG